jgi:NAD(P)-dependent dehydrogenase (short-subunit alcohol dehydrogenase family)
MRDRKMLVTGGASGIGLASARRFVAEASNRLSARITD